jgi:hypothetical protein
LTSGIGISGSINALLAGLKSCNFNNNLYNGLQCGSIFSTIEPGKYPCFSPISEGYFITTTLLNNFISNVIKRAEARDK